MTTSLGECMAWATPPPAPTAIKGSPRANATTRPCSASPDAEPTPVRDAPRRHPAPLRRRWHGQAHIDVDADQDLVPSAHAEISTAPRRTASSGSRASFPQAAATSGTLPVPARASCTPVCSQSAWLSSASATARATSLMAATVPTRVNVSAVCRVTAVSSTSSSSPTNASATSETSAEEARARPARTRCAHEGDDASAKAAFNPLVISGMNQTVSRSTEKIEPRSEATPNA